MNMILDFFSETLIMDWLFGTEILDLFDQYFFAQTETNRVLLIMGVGVLATLGALRVIRAVLKLTVFWLKLALMIGLVYYLFVVILGIDIWALFAS